MKIVCFRTFILAASVLQVAISASSHIAVAAVAAISLDVTAVAPDTFCLVLDLSPQRPEGKNTCTCPKLPTWKQTFIYGNGLNYFLVGNERKVKPAGNLFSLVGGQWLYFEVHRWLSSHKLSLCLVGPFHKHVFICFTHLCVFQNENRARGWVKRPRFHRCRCRCPLRPHFGCCPIKGPFYPPAPPTSFCWFCQFSLSLIFDHNNSMCFMCRKVPAKKDDKHLAIHCIAFIPQLWNDLIFTLFCLSSPCLTFPGSFLEFHLYIVCVFLLWLYNMAIIHFATDFVGKLSQSEESQINWRRNSAKTLIFFNANWKW